MTGSLINTGAVIAGGLLGLLLKSRFPARVSTVAFQGIGLFTICAGVGMSGKSGNFLILVLSIVLGGIIGSLLDLESRFYRFVSSWQDKMKTSGDRFTEGFITSSLLFCTGSMAILGAIEDGLGQPPQLLIAKSILDGFAATAMAAAMGSGVLFSAIPVLVYQGLITLFAASLEGFLKGPVMNELTAVGGLLLVGLGLNLLEIGKVKVMNLLPGLVVAIVLAVFIVP